MNPISPGMPTSEEIDRRLRLVGQLRNLCLSLGKARILPKKDHTGDPPPQDTPRRDDSPPRLTPEDE